MMPFSNYLLKVILVSGLLYGYYLIALRNKKFHQYNRMYLLISVLLSLIIPLVKINLYNNERHSAKIIKILTSINYPDVYVSTATKSGSFLTDYSQLALYAFLSVSGVAFFVLAAQIGRICRIIRSNPKTVWNDIRFVFTQMKGTPFSFFRYIFWDKDIDINNDEGDYILQHELVHVQQHHSLDKLLLNVVLVAGWANPVFWLIRNELNILHEFLADQKAVSNGDANAFAAMLLTASYPQHSFAITNSFFHSPIKRRLIMFTTSKKPSYSYLQRLMILPLLSFVIAFFSFKIKEGSNKSSTNSAKAYSQLAENKDLKEKIYKVVERFAVNKTCYTCENTGVSVIEISNLANTTEVKTVYASDNNFDFGNDKVLTRKLNEVSEQVKVPFDVIVPIHFFSYKDQQSPNPDITQPSPQMMKAAQEKIDNLDEQKTVYGPVVISTWSKNVNDKAETKAGAFDIVNPDTIEAKFPGGNEAWKKYLETNLNANAPVKDKAPAGIYTVKVQFIVTETGEIKDVLAKQIPEHCPSCAIEAVRIIKSGPKWEPTTINGKNAASQSVQFISFVVAES